MKFEIGDKVKFHGFKTEYEIAKIYPRLKKVDLKLVKHTNKVSVYKIGHIFHKTNMLKLEIVRKKDAAHHPLTNIFK